MLFFYRSFQKSFTALLLFVGAITASLATESDSLDVELHLNGNQLEFILTASNQASVDVAEPSNIANFAVSGPSDIANIIVSGPDDIISRSDSTLVSFDNRLKDGQYHYQINQRVFSDQVIVSNGENGREPGTTFSQERIVHMASGHFRVIDGVLVHPKAVE